MLTKLTGIFMDYSKDNKNIEVYTKNKYNGIIAFNINGYNSTSVGDILNEKYGIAVRTGLHCAPLLHKEIGTLNMGAVRVSFGFNNTEKEVYKLINALEKF
jgi:selenocysteine lyase/cysteine desulfurase